MFMWQKTVMSEGSGPSIGHRLPLFMLHGEETELLPWIPCQISVAPQSVTFAELRELAEEREETKVSENVKNSKFQDHKYSKHSGHTQKHTGKTDYAQLLSALALHTFSIFAFLCGAGALSWAFFCSCTKDLIHCTDKTQETSY